LIQILPLFILDFGDFARLASERQTGRDHGGKLVRPVAKRVDPEAGEALDELPGRARRAPLRRRFG